MSKTATSFWVEGLNAEEREHRVSSLFATLEAELGSGDSAIGVSAKRTYVFVPDPPPLTFDAQTQDFEIRRLSWGVAGRAAATVSEQVAVALAPVLFDLWSDALFVLAFEADAPDDATLGQWIEKAIGVAGEAGNNNQSLRLPGYALISFDWGDVVGETCPRYQSI